MLRLLPVKNPQELIPLSLRGRQVPDGHPYVVLSFDFWKTRFASDPNIVGKPLLIINYSKPSWASRKQDLVKAQGPNRIKPARAQGRNVARATGNQSQSESGKSKSRRIKRSNSDYLPSAAEFFTS